VSAVIVRDVAPGDRDAWQTLYRGYRDFYGKPHDDAIYDRVWQWLHDATHETRGLVAELDGTPIGIGHYRTFARPIDGGTGLYLDDLFTAAEARGTGAGTAILHRLAEIARDEGSTLVRWITAESNATARRLYDRVTDQTAWVTYDLKPAE
jgi:GNAT superfamily N-acetyltransferase